MFLLLFIYFLLGAVIGTLAGLLGIGGGIIAVPALSFIFAEEGFQPDVVMHIAVGTSLAIMVATTMRSLRSHLKQKGKDREEFLKISKKLIPTVIVGVVLGAVCADFLHSLYLRIIFGVFILIIAVRLFFSPKEKTKNRSLPGKSWVHTAGLIMGAISGLLGVGGGTTVIPYLLYWQVSMRVAVKVAIFVGLVVAVVGAITYFFSGMNEQLPAHCWGYIYWPAWVGTAIGSVLFAPLGVRLSYHTPTLILRRLFSIIMLIIAIHMLFFR